MRSPIRKALSLCLMSFTIAASAQDLTTAIPSDEHSAHDLQFRRHIEFAGRTWGVKESDSRVGPGSNYFSSSESDVWVDEDGLHMTIQEHDDHWWATEVVLMESLGYGTCVFQTNGRIDILDPNAVLGLFTWDIHDDWEAVPDFPNREIDFEYSRWSDPEDLNAYFIVQPGRQEGQSLRFRLPNLSDNTALTHIWTWQETKVDFTLLHGRHTPDQISDDDVIRRWTFHHDPESNHFVPDEGRENVRINLWLNQGQPPSDGQPCEVVISDFQFIPLDAPGR